MQRFLLITVLLLSYSTLSAEIFSWVDASGNTVYGDSPPENVAAESVAPPELTVLENFANRYADQATPDPVKTSSSNVNTAQTAMPKAGVRPYKRLKIIAPKPNQSIRADDGDISVAVLTTPKLRGGDSLVIYLNDQEHARAKSRVANLSDLERGEYQLAVEIQNANGQSLIRSTTMHFNVQKNSVIKRPSLNPYGG